MKIMRFKFVWENAIVTWYSVSISFFKSLVTRRTPVSGSIWKYLEAFPRPIISYLTWNYMFSGGPNWNYQTYFVSRSSSVRISGHQSSNCTSNGGVIFQSYWMGNYCKHRRNVITILKYNNLFNTTSFSIHQINLPQHWLLLLLYCLLYWTCSQEYRWWGHVDFPSHNPNLWL